ncbi:MAG: metallophosphoesterase [Clostridia bacterium]|nr:metallophosphoesterase [Clostridia bacterium]
MKHTFWIRLAVLCVLFLVVLSGMAGITGGSVDATGSSQDKMVQAALDLKHTLRFDQDGKFKIVIFSDIQDTYPPKTDTIDYMNKILDQEKPDLVLLGGDNHAGHNISKSVMKTYMNAICAPMESRKIPWAQVYGNHAEGGYNANVAQLYGCASKEDQQEMFESYAYNVSKAGSAYGVGNYVLPVLRSDSDKIGFNVFALDSHSYSNENPGGQAFENAVYLKRGIYGGIIYPSVRYETFHFDQVRWYWDTSVALEEYNGSKVAAMMIFHIPILEFEVVSSNPKQTDMVGVNTDGNAISEVYCGLFQTCYERGDVKGMFVGHQHRNDNIGTYMGIQLGYVPTIGSLAFYSADNRGARVIEVDQDDAFNFTTRMVYCKDIK